jgi:hypothetical protein
VFEVFAQLRTADDPHGRKPADTQITGGLGLVTGFYWKHVDRNLALLGLMSDCTCLVAEPLERIVSRRPLVPHPLTE